jgi:hypothetical protein
MNAVLPANRFSLNALTSRILPENSSVIVWPPL